MEQVRREGFSVNGISIRTTNKNENNQQGGKIAGLWQDFWAVHCRTEQQPAVVYGVYSNYASDQHGEYDVTAAVACDFHHALGKELMIPAGIFLKFAKSGPCPETVIALWQDVWNYFGQNCAPERTYLADFEEYYSPESVAIFIGIKEEA
jgi:predicted transcriptional regulator YdeE